MIYDKQRDAFRLVPIHRHIAFEKQKMIDRGPQEKPKSGMATTAKGGLLNSSLMPEPKQKQMTASKVRK